MRTKILRSLILLSLLIVASVSGANPETKANSHSNFDIRFLQTRPVEAPRSNEMWKREVALRATVPGLDVKYHAALGGPEIVGIKGGRGFLTPPSNAVREKILKDFLSENAALYGLTSEQISQLETIADYSNPAQNLSWVRLRQVINGIAVFRGEMRAAFTSKGELARTVSEFVPNVDYASLPSQPAISTERAIDLAAQSIGLQKPDNDVHPKLEYFPLKSGSVVLSWSLLLRKGEGGYLISIDAQSGELLFRKNLLNDQTQSATYDVYDDDSPAPLSPTNATPGSGIQGSGISRTTLTLISELPAFDDLGWITDGGNTTTGNNVDAGLDVDGTDGIDPGGRPTGSPFRVFSFSYDPAPLGSDDPTDPDYRFGAVTNVFFWANRYHDLVYQLGFTEADGNFQTNNFGRGGIGNDPVIAHVQQIKKNASFFTPADGDSGELRAGIFTDPTPNRDDDLDQDILLHEFTHGLSNRLHANAHGLNFSQSGGMGEGWSDFYARALLSDGSEEINALYAAGAYSTFELVRQGLHLGTDNYYYGVRRFPYAVKTNLGPNGKPHNPLTLADIDSAQLDLTDGAYPESPLHWSASGAGEVHNVGEIWCMSLLEVRARLISKLGFATGNQRSLQLVTDGMKLDPADPGLLDARDSILAADCASYGGADELDIWNGFSVRGMGFSAQSDSAYLGNSVVQAFDMPNVALHPVHFNELKTAPSCSNGFVDPGEKLDLFVPLTNTLCANSIARVVANMEDSPAKNYGTIPPGATVERDFNYKVPATATCGSQIAVNLQVKDSFGTVTRMFPLTIGQPVIAFAENFDDVTAPNLPAGWTTSSTSLLTPWVTTTTESDTAPNSIFGAEGSGSNTGTSELVSPAIAISTDHARLTFHHHVAIKENSDATLEISISGGAFEDIESAGGSFVEGGYNSFDSSWFSDSHNFFTTVIDLPASAAGKTIQLRWSLASFNIGPPRPGWFLDSVSIVDGYVCCP